MTDDIENNNSNNQQVWLTKSLPVDVDTLNFYAVTWCEEMLDAPTQEHIEWTECFISELLDKLIRKPD